MKLLAGLSAFALLAAGCSGTTVKCDDATIAEVARPALDGLPAAERADFAVKLLTETCSEPADLAASLKGWSNIPPDARGRTLGRAIEENSGLWKKGCKGGIDAFEETVRTAEREKALFEGCDLGRFPGVTAETLPFETALVAVLYAPVLEQSKAPEADKAAILKALLVR